MSNADPAAAAEPAKLSDLAPFVQRRELLAYEQRLARAVYAYGVDVRRASWLQSSALGEPIMRTVDRRWNKMVALLADRLEPPGTALPTVVLEELTRLIQQLRTPLPSIRILRASEAATWPIITPLATTGGGIQWLVVDLERLTALPEVERRFAIASSLAHLQCDHGTLFAAHLMAHLRGTRLGMVRSLLRPWTRVAYYSADRGGLLLTGDLAASLRAIEAMAERAVAWMPRPPELATRRQALEDFDRCDVMARVRLLTQTDPKHWAAAAARAAQTEGPMSQRIAAMLGAAVRLGTKVAMTLEGGALRRETGDVPPDTAAAPGAAAGGSAPASAEPAATAPEPPTAGAVDPSALDPDLIQRIEDAVRNAWSVARCDQRLTRRLGLL